MITTGNQRSDSSATVFALVSATIIIAHQVAGKATRDALFLSYFDVTQLPKMVIVAAVCSLLGVLTVSSLLPRFGPWRLVPSVFVLSAVLFVGEWLLFGVQPPVGAVVLYLHMAIFGAILISGFWSVINERFDPHAAKRTIARVAAAATLGGVLGGIVAERVSVLVDIRSMLLVLAALHMCCAASVSAIGRPQGSVLHESETGFRAGMRALGKIRYLQQMGLLMILMAVIAALLDYALKTEAKMRFTSSESLVAFFATFYAVVGVLSFAIQTLLGPRMLQRFGIGATISVLPVVVAVGGVMGSAGAKLWTVVMLRGAQAALAQSFFRSAFELLYTPLPPGIKRPTKTIIDVACDRFGDILGGGLVLLLLALIPRLPTVAVIGCAVAAAGICLLVISNLNRGYIDQLALSLRKGAVSLEDLEVVDATTEHILAETTAYSERRQLMERIKAMREARRTANAEPADVSFNDTEVNESDGLPDPGGGVPPGEEETRRAQLARAVVALSSGNPDEIRQVLFGDFMDVRLVPHLIPLLGVDEVAEETRMELRWMVPRIIGHLTDVLLDPDMPLIVRQRVPGILEVCHNPRAIEGLLNGLEDAEFNIRYSCARALARMRSRNSDLRVSVSTVYAAVKREVSVDHDAWVSRDLTLPENPEDGALDTDIPVKINRSVEHVFTILGLTLDRDALQLSLRGVFGDDPNLRGTALEYLENVLPEDIRRSLWRHIGGVSATPQRRRARTAILAELRDSFLTKPAQEKP